MIKVNRKNGNLRMGTIMKDSCINCNSIIHVAVVDDDNTFIERYTMMVDGFMKKNGLECSITCFADGNELIQNIDGSSDSLASFDLYCLDIEMPEMDGHRLTKLIKSDDAYKGIPVVIFSSLVNEEMRRKGETLGADAQLSKPEIGELVKEIDKLVLV